MENKILALTTVQSGVCVNDPFISLVQDLSKTLGREVDYFTFNSDPINPELKESVAKDTLDRLSEATFSYSNVLIDSRLDKTILNFIIGFILCSGDQIGSFFIDDQEIQEYLESKVILRKDHNSESEELLLVTPNDYEEESDAVKISEAIDRMIVTNYDRIKFIPGTYDIHLLYRVLSFCYGSGVIVIDWTLPIDAYIKVIISKW